MAELRKIRFISEEPKLAQALRRLQKEVKIQVLPPEWLDWGIDWVEDVGTVMRSRSYMAGTVAMYLSYALISVPFTMFPKLGEFRLLSKVLGVK